MRDDVQSCENGKQDTDPTDHVEIRQAGPGTQLDFASEERTIDEDSWVASSCYISFLYIISWNVFIHQKFPVWVIYSKE